MQRAQPGDQRMKIETIGVMSPGDMGQAIAQQLKNKGYQVLTALENRSERSKTLARDAGLVDVGSIAQLTAQCDVILSVMNPGSAPAFAAEVAQALKGNKRNPLVVDCNAIAPVTMQAIAAQITAAGGRCADGGIIGPPPRGTAKTTLYVSGPDAHVLEQIATPQIAINVMSDRVGDASAIKMCYAAMTKGVQALGVELLVAARRLGVDSALEAQFKASRSDVYNWVVGALPMMPPKAYRWVPEMLEIAKTFEAAGMTPRIFEGAADMYTFIASTALGRETPENRDKSRSGQDVVCRLADEPRK
jgi:3-hydroxyisobutyrate dehydrogenase-like beta-hydroxyacid dehydrogenase